MKMKRDSSYWEEYFDNRPYLIIDGALGTCIERKGHVLDSLLWSAGHLVSNPSIIQEIHEEYLQAGADIITTSAYQISYEGFLQRFNYCTNEVNDILRLSTDLARKAISSFQQKATTSSAKKFVAGSIGCYGAHLANGSEFFGGYSVSRRELYDWHYPKVQLLLQTNPDILAFETIPLLEEVKAVVRTIGMIPKTVSWVSVACKSSSQLNGGDSVEDVCRAMEDTNEDLFSADGARNLRHAAIGVNCTAPDHISSIISSMKECCRKDRRIVAYPNRGDFWIESSHSYADPANWSPEQYAAKAVEWYELGATILGGCCKTDSAYTEALVKELKNRT